MGSAFSLLSPFLCLSSRFQAKARSATRLALFSLAILLCLPAAAQTAHFSYVQSLVASSGLTNVYGVVVDSSGNIYITDAYLGTSSPSGQVVKETLQPDGSYVQSVVSNSELVNPRSVAVDGSGNVYVADQSDSQVFKETLQPDGSYAQSLIASYTMPGPYQPSSVIGGIAADASGNVYITDTNGGRILKETLSGGIYIGSVVASSVAYSPAVTVDGSGNVYFMDINGNVEKAAPSGGSYTTTTLTNVGALTDSGGETQTAGIAVDASGNFYIADTKHSRIIKAAPNSGGTYTTSFLVGSSAISGPEGIAVDANGGVYVADTGHTRVELFEQNVNLGSNALGSTSGSKSLTFTFDTGGMLAGTPYGVLTQGAAGLDFNAAATQPSTACNATSTYAAGNTCTVDVTLTPRLTGPRFGATVLYSSSGAQIAAGYMHGAGTGSQLTFAPGTQSVILGSGLSGPEDVAVDGSGNVYIADSAKGVLLKETLSGGSYTQSTVESGTSPFGVSVDGAGNVYISSSSGLYEETPSGSGYTQSLITSSGLSSTLAGVAVDGSGNVYVADSGNSQVVKETLSSGTYAQGTVANTGLSSTLAGVAVDASGNVYIADSGNSQVLKETPSASSYTQSTVVSGSTGTPAGIAVDGSGNVYITVLGGSEVIKETLSGGSYAQSTALSGLSSPIGVAVDGSDNLYVANSGNEKILKEDMGDPPAVSFPTPTPAGSTDTTDDPLTVTVSNIGTAALSFPIPTAGNNPSISTDFMLSSTGSDTCPLTDSTSFQAGSLAAGASCTLPITFAPTSVGSITGSLVLTDTNLNAAPSVAQTISLSGTGSQLVASFTVTRLVNAGAGTAQTITVTALNASNATATSYTGTVHFTSTDTQAVLPADYTFTTADAGVHTFTSGVTLKTLGLQSVTVADTVSTSSTGNEPATITAGMAAQIAVTLPGMVSPGIAFTAIYTARDAYGNTATTYAGPASLTSSDPGFVTPGNLTFVSGVAQDSLTLIKAGVQSVTATDTTNHSLTGTAVTTVAPGPAVSLAVTAPATAGIGAAVNFTVTAMDANGNVATAYTGPVHFTSTDSQAVLPANSSLTAGIGNFSATFNTLGSRTITATDTTVPSLSGTSNVITVTVLNLVVTTATDDTGNAADCTAQATPGTGKDADCSLRDALLEAGNAGGGNISFDATKFATAQTILLANGTLNVPKATTVQGPFTGSTTPTNLVTVAGSTATNAGCSCTVFTVSNGVTATLTNLNIAGGYNVNGSNSTNTGGGGIFNSGTLTVMNSAIYGNVAAGAAGIDAGMIGRSLGGGIFNIGTLTVMNSAIFANTSTVNDNSSTQSFAEGGGIYNGGKLTITSSTISGNTAANQTASVGSLAEGGGIDNDLGTVTITNSTIAGNTAAAFSAEGTSASDGGGIFNSDNSDDETMTIINSTIAGNSAVAFGEKGGLGEGGGIVNGLLIHGHLVLANSIVASNVAGAVADLLGPYADSGGNQIGVSAARTGTTTPAIVVDLAPLALNGGPTLTMLPLPGSPAICAGTVANATSLTTDQRGAARTTTYGSTTCVDAGAVQTHYALGFTTQPTDVLENTVMTPAPVVEITENGQSFTTSPVLIALTLNGPGVLFNDAAATSPGSNLATYPSIAINASGNADTLTANLFLNSANLNTLLTGVSNSFNVTTNSALLTFGTAPAVSIQPGGNAGSAITVLEESSTGVLNGAGSDLITLAVTGPGGYSTSYTATAVNGVATFNLSGAPLSAVGNYTYTASLAGAMSATATTTVATVDFSFSGSPAYQTVVPGDSTTYSYSLAPLGGSVYPGTVVLAVSGLPAGVTGTFSANNFAANAGSQTVTLTIATTTTAENHENKLPPWSLALLFLPFVGVKRLRRSSQGLRKALLMAVFVLGSGAALLGLNGCSNTVAGNENHTVTVTATSGTVVHTVTSALNLQ